MDQRPQQAGENRRLIHASSAPRYGLSIVIACGDSHADAILLLHFAIVIFITSGLPAIWIGAARGWRWVRNRVFRLAHLAAIVFVALESLAGVWCPLTVWEHALRGNSTQASEKSFVAHWAHRVMLYQFPEWVFTIAYVAFTLAVAATWWLVPPHSRARKKGVIDAL